MAGDVGPASLQAAATMVILPSKRARPSSLNQASTNLRKCASVGYILTTGSLTTIDALKDLVRADQDRAKCHEAESSSGAYRVLARSLAHLDSPYFEWALAGPCPAASRERA
jgi:hypothetical protein